MEKGREEEKVVLTEKIAVFIPDTWEKTQEEISKEIAKAQERLMLINRKIESILQQLGAEKVGNRYDYLQSAILACIEIPGEISIKPEEIYQKLAWKYDKSPREIEREIECAIQQICDSKESYKLAQDVLGCNQRINVILLFSQIIGILLMNGYN